VTLLELVILMAVTFVAVSIFSGTLLATVRQRNINHETAIAAQAMRAVIERMRNEDFRQIFALYNADPEDDPLGPGTGPGNRFAVGNLTPVEGAPDPRVGEIRMPVVPAEVGTALEVREDFVHPQLGLPRDLNGDEVVDDLDHSEDYRVLPVELSVEWQGQSGRRVLESHTVLARFRW
jgi:hypothetical protein